MVNDLTWEFTKLTISFIISFLSTGHPLTHKHSTNLLLCATQIYRSWLLDSWVNSFKFTKQPASYTLLLILPFFVFPLCARTCLVRDLFLMLHHLSGIVSLGKLGHQTHSHLSDHIYIYPIDSVCVCVRTRTHAQVCMGLIPTKQNPRVWNVHTHIYRQTCPYTRLHPNIWMCLSPKRELLQC